MDGQVDQAVRRSANQAILTGFVRTTNTAFLEYSPRGAAAAPNGGVHDGSYHHGGIHALGGRIRTMPFCALADNQHGVGLCDMKSA